jgi:hypothetical protein
MSISLRKPAFALAGVLVLLIAVPAGWTQPLSVCDQEKRKLEAAQQELRSIDQLIEHGQSQEKRIAEMADGHIDSAIALRLKQLKEADHADLRPGEDQQQRAYYIRVGRLDLDILSAEKTNRLLGMGGGSPVKGLQKKKAQVLEQKRVIEERMKALKCGQQIACRAQGQWTLSIPDLGPPSTLTIAADGTSQETGYGASGYAMFDGGRLTITWSTKEGSAGTLFVQLDQSCNRGQGTVNWMTAPEGVTPGNYAASIVRAPGPAALLGGPRRSGQEFSGLTNIL